MEFYVILFVIFLRCAKSSIYFPPYVPDLNDEDIETFGKSKSRIQDLDCKCGQRGPSIDTDTTTPFGEYPWIVYVNLGQSHSCWGSIISDLLVVTSAKCLVEYDNLKIEQNVFIHTKFDVNTITLQSGIKLSPKGVHCHPRAIPTYFTQRDIDYDICIIELKSRIDFKQNKIWPICIPDSNQLASKLVGQRGIGLGLKKLRHPLSNIQPKPQESWIYDNKYCGRKDDKRNLCTQFEISFSHAFKFENSGSPLIITLKSGQMLQVGISSGIAVDEREGELAVTRVEFSTNLANEEFVSFINKISDLVNTRWCKSKGGQTLKKVSSNFHPRPGTFGSIRPWEGFPSEYRKTTNNCACGIRESDKAQARVVGGEDSKRNEYRWQVQIIVQRHGSGSAELCGGTLINSKMILTAAHCVGKVGESKGSIAKANTVFVRLNRHAGFEARDEDDSQMVTVKNVYAHSGFVDNTDFRNDIALLELRRPVVFSTENKLSPVCIPTENEFGSNNVGLIGKNAIVIGWGQISTSSSTLAAVLQELEVPIWSNDDCNKGISYKVLMPEKTICAGRLNYPENYQDPSHGDSGGPLMVEVPSELSPSGKELVEVGIVSVGTLPGAASYETPGVWYTSVADYLPFIDYYSFKAGGEWCAR